MSPILYSDEESGSESEEATDDDLSYDDEEQDDATGSDAETDEEIESNGTCSGSVKSEKHDLYDNKACLYTFSTEIHRYLIKWYYHHHPVKVCKMVISP